MRTQDQNPAYVRFAYMMPTSGLYPARYVDIFWNRDDNRQIRDVEVVFIPRGAPDLPKPQDDQPFWNSYAAYNRHWTADLGNSCEGWLESETLTPSAIFGRMLRAGFASEGELEAALEEFAHIEECEWARDMLAGFNRQ